MRQIVLAIRAERMKLRRSKILLVTFWLIRFHSFVDRFDDVCGTAPGDVS